MKRQALTLLVFFATLVAMGQTANLYTFSTGTGATMLAPTFTQIVATATDDGVSTVQSIGFNFVYEGTTYTQFSANGNGLMRLGATVITNAYTNDLGGAGNEPKLMPLWDDLSTGSNGGVYTGLYGSSGSYIRVIEWRVFNTSSTASAYNCTFQVRLYEAGNIVEFAYGTGTTPGSFSCGIGGATATNYQSLTTSAHTSSTTVPNNANATWPGSGRYYRFANSALPGENCSNAQNLASLTSPYSGTTVGYADDISICKTGAPDRIFYISVPNGYTVDIWEPSNGYDEYEYMGYGAGCPGTTTINCLDNDALAHNTWTNSTGSTQTVWYVQDGYSNYSGTFNLSWTLTNPCTPPAAPTPVTSSPASITCGQTSNLNGTSAGNTIRWYDAASGGTLLGSSASAANFAVTPASTTTYYAEAFSTCASATRTSVAVTVNAPAAPTSVTATAATITCGQTSNLNATSAGNTIRWYTAASGGTLLGSSASGANFAVTPASTTTYYAETFATCASATRTSVTVTVNTPPAPISATANPNTITSCGQACTLTGISPGYTIYWYDAPSGGNLLGTSASGAVFPVIPIATTTYYAESFGSCASASRIGVTVTYTAAKADESSVFAMGDTRKFVKNMGQIADANGILCKDVLYQSSTDGTSLFFKNNGVVMLFSRFDSVPNEASIKARQQGDYAHARLLETVTKVFRMDLEYIGADGDATIASSNPRPEVSNYYLPQCPNGILDVPHYNKITYKDVYYSTNIDYYYTDKGLKYDIILNPGAHLSDIRFQYKGANAVHVNELGQLVVTYADGREMIEATPFAYYMNDAHDTADIQFTVDNSTGIVGFKGVDDVITKTLVIDPSITWATYFYGSVSANENWTNPEYDANGNLFLANQSYQAAFPTVNPGGGAWFENTNAYMIRIVIMKFDKCRSLKWSTYYGGDKMDCLAGCTDYGKALALDNSGNVFVSGYTDPGTTVFPTLNPGGTAFYQSQARCYGTTSFFVKFNNNGVRQWASIFQHEAGNTSSNAIRINGITCSGTYVYFTGEQYNWNTNTVPLRNPGGGAHYQSTILGDQDVFVGRFNASTCELNWCTYLHSTVGTNTAYGQGLDMHCDASGNLYVTGRESGTNSHHYLLNPGGGAYYQATKGANGDLFITKFNTSLAVVWSTYYGGDGMDIPSTVEPDGSGNMYILGRYTASTDFPTLNPGGGALCQTAKSNAASDGFLLKFSSAGVRLWATYLGGNVPAAGSDENHFAGIAYNANVNHVFVSGYTKSTTMPTVPEIGSYNQAANGGGTDMFYYEFNNSGVVLWSSYYGKASNENCYNGRLGCKVDVTTSSVFSVFSTNTNNLSGVNPGGSWYQGPSAYTYNDFFLELSKPLATLPIELAEFTAHCSNGKVELDWSTYSEINNSYFTIEKSADAVSWEVLSTIPGAGNSNNLLKYSAFDIEPYNGTTYYRLKQTDFDGAGETYDPIAVSCTSDEEPLQLQCYPNPFRDELTVSIPQSFNTARICLVDMLGSIVLEKQINGSDLIDNKIILNVHGLTKGVYTVSVAADAWKAVARVIKVY